MADAIAAQVARLADLTLGPRAYFDVIALGTSALPELERLVRGAASTIYQPRVLAVDAVAQIGGAAATEVLLRALTDSVARSLDPILRQAEDVVGDRICAQLGAAPDEPRVRDALLTVLDRHAYPSCAGALGKRHELRAARALARWLADDTMREPAADALRILGIAALPETTRVLVVPHRDDGEEPPAWVDGRVVAAAIVADVGGEAAELPLIWSLDDVQPAVRRAAALAIGARGPEAAEIAAPALIEGLAAESWIDREAAAETLRAMGEAAAGPLAEALRALPRDGAVAAIAILADLGHVVAVGELCTHADRRVRWAAVDALAKRDLPERMRFARDPEREIRRRART